MISGFGGTALASDDRALQGFGLLGRRRQLVDNRSTSSEFHELAADGLVK